MIEAQKVPLQLIGIPALIWLGVGILCLTSTRLHEWIPHLVKWVEGFCFIAAAFLALRRAL